MSTEEKVLGELIATLKEFYVVEKWEDVKDVELEDLGLDSIDVVEMIMELEERLDITLPDEECGGLTTAQSFYELCLGKALES